jgi:uncharacterized membrane protein
LKYTLFVFFVSLPLFALANSGSPVVWFNIFHLLFFNAIIGYIESEILLKYKIPNKLWLVIIANYTSMIIGFYVLMPTLIKGQFGGNMWDRSFGVLLLGFALSFIATLIIEYFIFVAALKDKAHKQVLFKPFLIANIVTNVSMIFIYYLLGSALT